MLKEPPVIRDIALLAEPFRSDAEMLVQALEDEHLPMRLFETKRSIERQNYLFAKGVTRARGSSLESPHIWGLAIDVILDVKHDHWKRKKATPTGGWDTGVHYDGKACRVVEPEIVAVWARYGAIATRLGFVWGGKNEGPWKSARPGDVFGWDPAHSQAASWRVLAGKMTPPTS
jgi:hypothetical protein